MMARLRFFPVAAVLLACLSPVIARGNGLVSPTLSTTLVRPSSEITVNTVDDVNDGCCDGAHCSLREAILAAEGREGPDTIVFDTSVFPPGEAGVIQLATSLPSLHNGQITIDGSLAGVTVDGSQLTGEDIHGFFIQSSGNTLRGMRLQNLPGVGVVIGAFDGNVVHDNTVDGVGVFHSGYGGRWDSIWIMAYCATCRAYGNEVVNCTVEDGADDGIEIWSQDRGKADDNVVAGTVVSGTAEVGIEVDVHGPGGSVDGNTIRNNVVRGTREQGGIVLNAWLVGTADGNVIRDNLVEDNTEYGIWVLGGTGSACDNGVTGNEIAHHREAGIMVSCDETGVATGNQIVGNTVRDHDRVGEGTGILLHSDNNLVYHNNLINNHFSAQDSGLDNSWDNGTEGNYWDDYGGSDQDGDGIGDTAYDVPSNGTDRFPLMERCVPWRIFLPLVMRGEKGLPFRGGFFRRVDVYWSVAPLL